jgi:hypothetical protein
MRRLHMDEEQLVYVDLRVTLRPMDGPREQQPDRADAARGLQDAVFDLEEITLEQSAGFTYGVQKVEVTDPRGIEAAEFDYDTGEPVRLTEFDQHADEAIRVAGGGTEG